MTANHTSSAFTIVELLIVVVVIAILAAITIVAYNGVTGRAKASAAQSAAETASKKVLTYMVTNSDQVPADLATAGITDSNSTTYQYSTNTSTTPQTFCITATTSNVSYYIDSTTHTSPTAGGCPGHAQNGGVAVTNLVTNPSVEADTSGWGYSVYSGSSVSSGRSTLAAHDGSYGVRMTWLADSASVSGGNGYYFRGIPVSVGATYTASMWVRPSSAQTMQLNVEAYNASSQRVAMMYGLATTISAGRWTRLSQAFNVSDSTTATVVITAYQSGGSALWKTNDTLDADSVMLTTGSTLYGYADPLINSSWIWNGTANASTSTGPAQ